MYSLYYIVLVFDSPFSIAITSLGEERANLSAFRTVWSICACLVLSVSSYFRRLVRAAVCDCGTPKTFLLPFLWLWHFLYFSLIFFLDLLQNTFHQFSTELLFLLRDKNGSFKIMRTNQYCACSNQLVYLRLDEGLCFLHSHWTL